MTIPNEYKVSNIINKDGKVNYYGKILSCEEANQYFGLLMQNVLWEKDEVIILVNILLPKGKLNSSVILNICILCNFSKNMDCCDNSKVTLFFRSLYVSFLPTVYLCWLALETFDFVWKIGIVSSITVCYYGLYLNLQWKLFLPELFHSIPWSL